MHGLMREDRREPVFYFTRFFCDPCYFQYVTHYLFALLVVCRNFTLALGAGFALKIRGLSLSHCHSIANAISAVVAFGGVES
jgi:hypothetical protein